MERRLAHERWLHRLRIREAFQRPIDPELAKELAADRQWRDEQAKITPPCSECGQPGQFLRQEGRYTRVWGVYLCLDGHLFTHG